MSQQLVIRLGATPAEEIFYAVVDDRDYSVLESGSLKNAEELSFLESRSANGAVVLLPSCRFFFKQLSYPKRFSSGMKNSIPYMIEDEVASEPDELEVSVLRIQGRSVDIIAYDRSYLQQVKEELESCHIKAVKYVPDIFALPYRDGRITFAALGKDGLFRISATSGFSLEESLAQAYFASFTGNKSFICLSELPESVEGEREEQYAESIMEELARGAIQTRMSLEGIESTQDRIFAVNGAFAPWLKVAVAAGILMVAYVGALLCKYQEVNRENQLLKSEIVKVFKSRFPQVTRVVNPIVQFRQLTNQSRPEPGRQGFIESLYQVISGFSPQVKMLNFRYDGKGRVFSFKLSYQDVDVVDALRESLEDRNYVATVSELRMEGQKNSAVLTIKEK
ncbi:MAG: type II secretion system protein GspL [Succinivibrionaceae bacterium]